MTQGAGRRFVLVDPCIHGFGGHPYSYAAEVLAAAVADGWEGRLATHASLPLAGLPAQWTTLPVFSHGVFTKYNAFGGLERADAQGRDRLRMVAPWMPWRAARRRREHVVSFAREIAPLLAGLRAGDVVLVATATELQVLGLARAIAAARPPMGVAWHLQFHVPILRGGRADYPAQARRLAGPRRMMLEALESAAPHRLSLHATTEELAAQYGWLVGREVGVLPYPVRHGAPPDSEQRRDRLTVASLGDLRAEKWSQHLAGSVAAACADPDLESRLRFVVQSNYGFPPHSGGPGELAVMAARGELDRLAAGGGPVELVPGPLTPADYAMRLADADVMLLAYDQDRYRARCSGVLLETLAAGATPIVTGGGWMARQLAAPIAAHVAAVTATGREVGRITRTLPAAAAAYCRITRAELAPDLPPDAAAFAVIRGRFHGAGTAAVDEPLVRVEAAGEAATILAADPGGAAAVALVPLADAAATVTVSVPSSSATAPAIPCDIACFVAGSTPPRSAVGMVVAGPADVPAALREIVRHADHYRASAAAHAAAVRAGSSGAAVVAALDRA